MGKKKKVNRGRHGMTTIIAIIRSNKFLVILSILYFTETIIYANWTNIFDRTHFWSLILTQLLGGSVGLGERGGNTRKRDITRSKIINKLQSWIKVKMYHVQSRVFHPWTDQLLILPKCEIDPLRLFKVSMILSWRANGEMRGVGPLLAKKRSRDAFRQVLILIRPTYTVVDMLRYVFFCTSHLLPIPMRDYQIVLGRGRE